ncbi:unnamed protein product [Meloidogyne enterolobii]|uniref:Uncharacterized protein n=1 Tax=Meloidogyne enterolobii TaxID=390850 RepID=A0ACB1A8Z1_MELEN
MKVGASLFTLLFLLVVNLSLFTEVDSLTERPWWKKPIRSVPDQGFRARRYARRNSILATPERMRVVREQGFRASRHATGMDSILAPMDNEDTRRG